MLRNLGGRLPGALDGETATVLVTLVALTAMVEGKIKPGDWLGQHAGKLRSE